MTALIAALSPLLLGVWSCPDGRPCSIAWPVLTHEANCHAPPQAERAAEHGCCPNDSKGAPSPERSAMVCLFSPGSPAPIPDAPAPPTDAPAAILPELSEIAAAEPPAAPSLVLAEPAASPPRAPILPRAPPSFAA